MKPAISIGILAHNEASNIQRTLESLFRQTVFHKAEIASAVEVMVVANGCGDRTVEIATAALTRLAREISIPLLSWTVLEIAEAGKSNAWNLFVHEHSAGDASLLCLMDADIQFLQDGTIERAIAKLALAPETWVVTDLPLKDIQLKRQKGLLAQASLASCSPRPSALCGQFYCGQAAVLRRIWMPKGLPVEDGFLRGMVLTDRFTGPEVEHRVQRVEGAAHLFEAYVGWRSLLRHERRLIVGDVINSLLFRYLWAKCSPRQDAGELIRRNNHRDPDWLARWLREVAVRKGGWIVPPRLLFRRFRKLKSHSLLGAIVRLPIALSAFVADLALFVRANRQIQQGRGLGYW
ncbi:glycosyltransferase family 2 protein [Synechococcus sp. PCC 7336]|uniref:glycosyltransferase family 2 protein n=1 Tax=Synechococcus sp. PCC 7336 TaxID=195250 RepID=UPI0003469D01|nr:glycosyltransferase family 2 protein [Synechococcus sp. PCC 7336]